MHAIKLHFQPKPFLGQGSYLIPITTWKVARDQMRSWFPILTSSRGGTGKRCYITLAKIPDDFPVILDQDWIGGGNYSPMPLKDIPKKLKDEIMAWYDYIGQEPAAHYVGARSSLAQLILGAPLPRNCIKWIKDLRLLYRGDKRRKKRLISKQDYEQ